MRGWVVRARARACVRVWGAHAPPPHPKQPPLPPFSLAVRFLQNNLHNPGLSIATKGQLLQLASEEAHFISGLR